MAHGKVLIACLAAFIAGAAGLPRAQDSGQEDLQAGLTADVILSDRQGNTLHGVVPGEEFVLTVRLTDAVTGLPPKGLALEGWLRIDRKENLSCTEAARAFRATRQIPNGSIDLNGVLLVAFNDDGSFGIADPRLDLATANMIAAGTLPETPTIAVTDDESQSVLMFERTADRIMRLSMAGALSEVTGDIGRVKALLPSRGGTFWIALAGQNRIELRSGTKIVSTVATSAPPGGMVQAGPAMIGAWAGTELFLMDGDTGRLRAREQAGTEISTADFAVLEWSRGHDFVSAAFIGSENETGWLAFGDALDSPVAVALAAPAERVAIAPANALALFWNPDGRVSVIDLATARLAAAFAVDRPISELAFAGEAAFFLTRDQSSVYVLDLASVSEGEAPAIREVRLGPRQPTSGSSDGLLISLEPSAQVLAINRETYTGFIVDERSAMGDAPPMTAVRLRGGRPSRVLVIDRSLKETETGTFVTVAALPDDQPRELVMTTGIGGMSACFRIDVETSAGNAGNTQPELRIVPVTMKTPVVQEPAHLEFLLTNDEGGPMEVHNAHLETASLEHGWRAVLTPILTGERLSVDVTFPVAGLYAMRFTGLTGGEPFVVVHIVEVGR